MTDDPDTSPRDGRSRRWDAHRQNRRAELVDAAIRAIRTHGPTVGMGEIASAAHTSKTVVYRHFADKAALYGAVCERVVVSILDGMGGYPETGNLSPRDLLAMGIDHYLKLIESDPLIYRFVVHPPAFDRRPDPDPLSDLTALIGQRVTVLLADMLRTMGADAGPAPALGHGLVGLVRAAADNWLERGHPISREVLTAQLTTFAWSGLASHLPATDSPSSGRQS